MAQKVFISFSSRDQKMAASICNALEARGHACWMSSRDVAPGENYQGAIVRAICDAGAMVLVFSANANNSDEIKKELSLASQKKLVVIPVRSEDVLPSADYRYELATRQWIDLFDNWEQALDRLARQIDHVIPREATAEHRPDLPPPAAASPVSREPDNLIVRPQDQTSGAWNISTAWVAAGVVLVLLFAVISLWPYLQLESRTGVIMPPPKPQVALSGKPSDQSTPPVRDAAPTDAANPAAASASKPEVQPARADIAGREKVDIKPTSRAASKPMSRPLQLPDHEQSLDSKSGLQPPGLVAGPSAAEVSVRDVAVEKLSRNDRPDPKGEVPDMSALNITPHDAEVTARQMIRDLLQAPKPSAITKPIQIYGFTNTSLANEGYQQLDVNVLADIFNNQLAEVSRSQARFFRHVAGRQSDAAYQLQGRVTALSAYNPSSQRAQRTTQLHFELTELGTDNVIWSSVYSVEKEGLVGKAPGSAR